MKRRDEGRGTRDEGKLKCFTERLIVLAPRPSSLVSRSASAHGER